MKTEQQRPKFFENMLAPVHLKDNTNLYLTLLVAVIIAVLPMILKKDYYIHIGCMVGINILVALGMYVVTGASGQINMGQFGFYCVGAYTAAILTTKLPVGFWTALCVSIVVCGLIGLAVGFLALRIDGPYLALTTLAFGESVRLIINNADWAGKAAGIMRISKLSIFGVDLVDKTACYYFIMAIALVALILINNLMRSRQGRRLRAIKDDAIASSVMGVDVRRTKVTAFCISAILGGIAGCIYACFSGYVNPSSYTQALQVKYLLMIVLGGLGSQWGALAGATVVTIFYELTRAYGEYQNLAAGALMVLVILVLRRGIVGTAVHAYQQWLIRKTHEYRNKRDGEGASEQ